MKRFIAIDTSLKYGKLKLLYRVADTNRSHKRWACLCDCGTRKIVFENNLKSGGTKSCGCLKKEQATSHGMSKTSIYKIWKGIKKRCYNPKCAAFKNYGGRGIKVCDRWKNSFENFHKDMGDRPSKEHSIERKDNNGDYEPNNCIWLPRYKQSRNRRNTLTSVAARVIRRLRYRVPGPWLARKFNVGHKSIYAIWNNINWKDA